MRFLVTGGAGFIGSHLCERLCNGNKVVIIDNLSTGSEKNISSILKQKSVFFVKGDVSDKRLVEHFVKKADVVYHLAAAVGVKKIMEDPSAAIMANIVGSHNIIESCARHKKALIFASTSEVYGKSKKFPLKEADDRIYGATEKLRWSYAESKALDEMLALAYMNSKGLKVSIIRLFNVVGERQSSFYGMVLPRFVEQALQGKPITVYGNGKQTRCFSYVGDIADCLADIPNRKDAFGEVINLGSNEEITIIDLAKKVKTIARSSSKITFVPYELVQKEYGSGFEDIERRLPSLSKAEKILGFRPKTKIDEIIKRVIADKKNLYKQK